MELFLKKYSWIVYLSLVFFGTFFLAKIASSLIASKIHMEKKLELGKVAREDVMGKKRQSLESFKIILDRNIFDSREIEPETVEEGPEAPTEVDLDAPAVKTSLPIKLLSTFSVGDGTHERSTATVSGGSGGKADIYTVNDEKQFAPGVKIVKILPHRIEFINGPRLEFAEIEDFGGGLRTKVPHSQIEKAPFSLGGKKGPASSKGIKSISGEKFVIDRGEVESALGNLDKLFTQIRAVPQFRGGKPSGLKLLSVRSGSIFAKLGLKRNDVLEKINGQDVDIKRGFEIFSQLKDSSSIKIDLVRNGKKKSLEYEIQ